MAALRNRACIKCKAVQYTRSKSEVCLLCAKENVREALIIEERAELAKHYQEIDGPVTDNHGHRVWSFTHECGERQSWVYGNFLKRRKEDPDSIPCSKCGGKRRMAVAMSAYEAKYGITEEQMVEYERYCKKVRHLSDKVFKEHHDEINPLQHKRGMHSYHLDHIMPIIEGFIQGLTPEFVARKENLQMLPAKDNLSKGRR